MSSKPVKSTGQRRAAPAAGLLADAKPAPKVIDAETEQQVFAKAATALAELISLGREGDEERHAVAIKASDQAALLVEWLEEPILLPMTPMKTING